MKSEGVHPPCVKFEGVRAPPPPLPIFSFPTVFISIHVTFQKFFLFHFYYILYNVCYTTLYLTKNALKLPILNIRISFFCHARTEQSKERLFPLPVGLSSSAFSLLFNALIICMCVWCQYGTCTQEQCALITKLFEPLLLATGLGGV